MQEHRFTLDKTRGRKYACPECGDKKSFRRYVDRRSGQEIADDCGKCDHENKCKYHKPPREWFAEHHVEKDDWLKRHEVPEDWAKKGQIEVVEEKTTCTLPSHLVDEYHSTGSNFTRWLYEKCVEYRIDVSTMKQMYDDYALGACIDGRVVFWQIDIEQRVRAGKMMQYQDNGHRYGNPDWMHTYLIEKKILPKDWKLSQCFFGEHLLQKYPTKKVCIVESEKSAVVCSVFHPEKLWLATGGCGGLNAEKLKVLKGRDITIYPDSGEFWKWYSKILKVKDMKINIVSDMEVYIGNTDIADVILGEAIQKE